MGRHHGFRQLAGSGSEGEGKLRPCRVRPANQGERQPGCQSQRLAQVGYQSLVTPLYKCNPVSATSKTQRGPVPAGCPWAASTGKRRHRVRLIRGFVSRAFSFADRATFCYTALMASKLAIGFLGTGKMATALARGFIRAGLVKSNQVAGSDPSAPARQAFANETGAKALASNGEVVACSTVLVLAVKPDHAAEVLTQVRPGFTANHLLISIVAGVTLGRLEAGLGAGARVIRVMPNT